MKHKFELKDAFEIGWPGLKGKAYCNADDFGDASAVLFEVTGRHGKVKSLASNRVYFVLSGEGEFTVNEEKIAVKETDVIIIPKNTPYDYRATNGTTLKLFLVHSPAFAPEKEIKLE